MPKKSCCTIIYIYVSNALMGFRNAEQMLLSNYSQDCYRSHPAILRNSSENISFAAPSRIYPTSSQNPQRLRSLFSATFGLIRIPHSIIFDESLNLSKQDCYEHVTTTQVTEMVLSLLTAERIVTSWEEQQRASGNTQKARESIFISQCDEELSWSIFCQLQINSLYL